MVITQSRFKWTDSSTLGQWHIDGESLFYSNIHDKMFPIFTLEDTDRDLHQFMSEQEVRSIKIPKHTAIPYGNYKVILSMSARFKKLMPEVVGVKGFTGIRIHNGSFIGDTEGCPLIGYKQHYLPDKDQFMVSKSRDCFSEFMSTLRIRLQKEEVYLNIVK